MAVNYSSVDAYLNWMRTFGESTDEFTKTIPNKLGEEILKISSPSKKRHYQKQWMSIASKNSSISQDELHSQYDNVLQVINRINAFRQKNTSLLNFLLQIYLVISVTEQTDLNDNFNQIAFRHMVIFNIFAAMVCYGRLLTVLMELYHADEEERKVILHQRQFSLLTDGLSATIHALRLAYMAMHRYQALPLLGVAIFSIDAFVALYELYDTYQEHHQSVIDTEKNITGFDCADYFSMNCKTRMAYLKQEFENCEDNQQKLHWLNLIVVEQKFQLDFWKKACNLILCAAILVAFILIQQYLVISMPGIVVSQEFIQCINAFIIYFCYFIRDMVLEHVVPAVFATDRIQLEYANQKVELEHGEVFEEKQESNFIYEYLRSEVFVNILIIGFGVGLFAMKVDLVIIVLMLPVILLLKEIAMPNAKEEGLDVTDANTHHST